MVAVARLEKESRRRDEYEKEDLSVSNIHQLKTFLERYRKDKVFRGIRFYIPNPNKMNQKVVCSIRTLQGGGFTQHGFMPTGTDLCLCTEDGKNIKSLTFPLSKNYKGVRTYDEYFDDAVKYFQESVLLVGEE